MNQQLGALERAIIALSNDDQDMASTRNDIGFNGADTVFGNSLADQIRAGRRLSDKQRAAAQKMLPKYHRQLDGVVSMEEISKPVEPVQAVSRSQFSPAKMPGTCETCRQRFEAGTMISFEKDGNRWIRRHAVCPGPNGGGEDYDEGTIRVEPMGGLGAAAQAIIDAQMRTEMADDFDLPMVRANETEIAQKSPVRDVLGPEGSIARMLPGYEAREQQLRGADLMYAGMTSDQHVTAELGTGTGKSLAYLVSGILTSKGMIVSTADKALQEQIVGKDIPFLMQEGAMPVPFTAALLKGRRNYMCHERLDTLNREGQFSSAEAGQAFGSFVEWFEGEDGKSWSGDLDGYRGEMPGELRSDLTVDSDACLGKRCPFFSQCFVEGAKDRAKGADVVVVNHALLLRDASIRDSSEGFASIIPQKAILALDEAHHLEDEARKAFGSEVTVGRWNALHGRIESLAIRHATVLNARKAVKAMKEGQQTLDTGEQEVRASLVVESAEKWQARLDSVSNAVDALFSELGRRSAESKAMKARLGDESELHGPINAALVELFRRMEDSEPSWLGTERERTTWGKLAKSVNRLANDFEACLDAESNIDPEGEEIYVRYMERERTKRGERIKLLAQLIDVSGMLRKLIFGSFDSVVSCSATLATGEGFGYWKERVGLSDSLEMIASSPFDYQRNALLYMPSDGKKFDPRSGRGGESTDYLDNLAREIEQLILASDGRVFALFTSYATLNAVYDRLAPRLSRYLVLKQGEQNRTVLVERFKQDGNAVLFGTKSFWEGVDVQGDALSLVVIDKLPFNAPDDPVWSALCESIDRKHGKMAWFFKLAIPFATINLKQGFGRLIRSKSDRGVVALLDGRLTTVPYGEKIVRALPPATRTRSLDAVKAHFGHC